MTRTMSVATTAFVALQAAMVKTDPLCLDDERFTNDGTDPQHVIEMCNLCPLFAACKAYALAARPTGGIWAGKKYTTTSRKTNRTEA